MRKNRRSSFPLHLLAMAAGGLAAAAAWACGPFFPASYFPYPEGNGWKSLYDVHPDKLAELALIGRHYYPEWVGKAPPRNPVKSAEADELDFLAAARVAGADAAFFHDFSQFCAFRDAAADLLKAGEEVALPQDIPPWAREFYLYAFGRAQRLADAEIRDPAPWRELLALPPEQRHYRTVWVHFGLVIAQDNADGPAIDAHLRDLRRALDDGFADTCALGESVLRQLARRDGPVTGLRFLPLCLAAYLPAPDAKNAPPPPDLEWIRRDLAMWFGHPWEYPTRNAMGRATAARQHAFAQWASADPVWAEVLLAVDALPSDVMPSHPVLEADRQAWWAFERGDLAKTRQLLALAPEDSLIRLFLEARLARLDGDIDLSAQKLHRWLEVWEEHARPAVPASRVGYTDRLDESFLYPAPQDPGFPAVVAGELGVIEVTQADVQEALWTFSLAHDWLDMAYVAERCLLPDELAAFLRAHAASPAGTAQELWSGDNLQHLALRRFLRLERDDLVAEFAPPGTRDDIDRYQRLRAAVADLSATDDARALAAFNLALLLSARGMQLLGTELEPDNRINEGRYPISGFPQQPEARRGWGGYSPASPLAPERPDNLMAPTAFPHTVAATWQNRTIPSDIKTLRYHYRRLALDAADRAATQATDPDLQAAALVLCGALNWPDASQADFWYKQLCKLGDHPFAADALATHWFPRLPLQALQDSIHRDRRPYGPAFPPLWTLDDIHRFVSSSGALLPSP